MCLKSWGIIKEEYLINNNDNKDQDETSGVRLLYYMYKHSDLWIASFSYVLQYSNSRIYIQVPELYADTT
jgi:hypothetical protein